MRWKHYGPEDAQWVKKGDVQADRLIKKYHKRRKILREYNEAATTKEDAFVFGMLATSEPTTLGACTVTLPVSTVTLPGPPRAAWPASVIQMAPLFTAATSAVRLPHVDPIHSSRPGSATRTWWRPGGSSGPAPRLGATGASPCL